MWLPSSVYERIPQFWLLLGLLFMSSGTYLGFETRLSLIYFGVGVLCCIWSLIVFSRRLKNRKNDRKFPVSETVIMRVEREKESAESGAEPAA